MSHNQPHRMLMRVLIGLLCLLLFGLVCITANAQGTYEGRPVYDATTAPGAPKIALPCTPVGPTGHARSRVIRHRRPALRRRLTSAGWRWE